MDLFLTALHFAAFILMFVLRILLHFFSALVCSDFCSLSLNVYPHFLYSVPYLLLRPQPDTLQQPPFSLFPSLTFLTLFCLSINQCPLSSPTALHSSVHLRKHVSAHRTEVTLALLCPAIYHTGAYAHLRVIDTCVCLSFDRVWILPLVSITFVSGESSR